MLNNMYDQTTQDDNATTEGEADGQKLKMTISKGGTGGSTKDDSLKLEITQPVVIAPLNPEDIHFLSNSLNKKGADGTWEINGMLVYVAEFATAGIQVKATLYDKYGTVLDSQNGWVQDPILYPNKDTPYLVRIYSPPANFDHNELSISPSG